MYTYIIAPPSAPSSIRWFSTAATGAGVSAPTQGRLSVSTGRGACRRRPHVSEYAVAPPAAVGLERHGAPGRPPEYSDVRLSTLEYSGVLTHLVGVLCDHPHGLVRGVDPRDEHRREQHLQPEVPRLEHLPRRAIRRVLYSALQGVSTARYSRVLYSVAAGTHTRSNRVINAGDGTDSVRGYSLGTRLPTGYSRGSRQALTHQEGHDLQHRRWQRQRARLDDPARRKDRVRTA